MQESTLRIATLTGGCGFSLVWWVVSFFSPPPWVISLAAGIAVILLMASAYFWFEWWQNRGLKQKNANFSQAQKNRLISNLGQHRGKIAEVKLAYEPGQRRYTDELYFVLNNAGWRTSILEGHTMGNPPGLTIEACDDSDTRVLFEEFSKEGIRVQKRILSGYTKGHVCLIVGETI